jgi:DNA-binding GntR family transcriptional regulator
MSSNTRRTVESNNKQVLAVSVYEALKERIMDQIYPPGSRLNIDALSSELNVSPTPVREALARLAAERLVTFEQFKGYSVNPPLTAHQVADLMHVRKILEVDAARQAALRIMRPDLLAMEKILAELSKERLGLWSEGYRQFNQTDQRFHEILFSAAGNPFLTDAYQALNVHIQLARFSHEWGDAEQCDTCSEHEAIYQALANHDPEAAARAIEAHLNATEERVYGLIETHPQVYTDRNGYKV